jgi:hypothetical protein
MEKGAREPDSMTTELTVTDDEEVFWNDTVESTAPPPIGRIPKFSDGGVAAIGTPSGIPRPLTGTDTVPRLVVKVKVPCCPPTIWGSKVTLTGSWLPELSCTGAAKGAVVKAPEAPEVEVLTDTPVTVTSPDAVKVAVVSELEPRIVSFASTAVPVRGGAPSRGPKAKICPS